MKTQHSILENKTPKVGAKASQTGPAQTETGTHSQEIVVDPKVFDQAHGLREIEPRRYDLELKYVERAERAEAHAERLAEALKHWQDWADGKRAWPKLETNEALAQWEQQR